MPEVAESVASLLARGADRLREAQVPAPRREALQLWADLRGVTPASIMVPGQTQADDCLGAEFLVRVERRAAGEPRAYVCGMTGFRHLTLACDRRALIPRPETEGLVDLLLARVRAGQVADIGTGTGCLALSLAVEGGFREVVAVDRSAEALALAERNRQAHGTAAAAVRLVRGDLCAPLRAASLDALVANPPYLSEREYEALDPSVKAWEPALALVSGPDGLDATTRLLDEARRVLRPGGWLALEVDCTRAAETARRAVALGWSAVAIYNDLFDRERYLLARRSELS
jgi:release factor glutamine methyltransferase